MNLVDPRLGQEQNLHYVVTRLKTSQQPSGGIAASDQSTQLGGPNAIGASVKSTRTNFVRLKMSQQPSGDFLLY